MSDEPPIEEKLARLADGSLPDGAASELRAQIRDSPELQARLRAQQRALGLIAATAQVTAPAGLRAAVDDRVSARRSSSHGLRTGRPRWRPLAVATPALAAIAAVVVIILLSSGGSGQLTVARTARLSLAGSVRGAPRVDPTDSDLLSLRVGSIPFPAYERHSDWRATGARTDDLHARRVQTVFYDIAGRRVGYSIVAGRALHVPAGDRHTIAGVTYVSGDLGSAELVTWRRDGHTCVIAGRQVSERLLLTLADATRVTT